MPKTLSIHCPNCREEFTTVVVTEIFTVENTGDYVDPDGCGADRRDGPGKAPHIYPRRRAEDGTFVQGQKVLRQNAEAIKRVG